MVHRLRSLVLIVCFILLLGCQSYFRWCLFLLRFQCDIVASVDFRWSSLLFGFLKKSIHSLTYICVLLSSSSPTLRMIFREHTCNNTHKQTHKQTYTHAHAHHVQQSNGQAGNTVRISYFAPVIDRLLCSACWTAGGNLTLTGTDFGSSAGAGTNASVRVGGSECAVLTPFDHELVRCALPAGQGTLSVTITISGQVLLSVLVVIRGEWSGWN